MPTWPRARSNVSTPTADRITATSVRNACIVTNWASDSVATIVTSPITPMRNTIRTQPAALTVRCDSSSRTDRVRNVAASATPATAAATPSATRPQLGSQVNASSCSLRSMANDRDHGERDEPDADCDLSLAPGDRQRPVTVARFVAPPREGVDGGDDAGATEHGTEHVAADAVGLVEHDQTDDRGDEPDAEHRESGRARRAATDEGLFEQAPGDQRRAEDAQDQEDRIAQSERLLLWTDAKTLRKNS